MSRDDRPAVRFAIIGDVEPKPEPTFAWLPRIVETINGRHRENRFDFVAGVGDVARNGTIPQYEGATAALVDLEPPFHTIMGNEELEASEERFFEYATRWNDDPKTVPDVQYVKAYGGYRFVFASPLIRGRSFTDDQLDWFVERLDEAPKTPAIGFVHTAPQDVLPEGRSMIDRRFDRVLEHPSLRVVFHGHSHIDVGEYAMHGTDDWGTDHLHVSGVERTKAGKGHISRFPIVHIHADGTGQFRYYNVERDEFEPDLELELELHEPRASSRSR